MTATIAELVGLTSSDLLVDVREGVIRINSHPCGVVSVNAHRHAVDLVVERMRATNRDGIQVLAFDASGPCTFRVWLDGSTTDINRLEWGNLLATWSECRPRSERGTPRPSGLGVPFQAVIESTLAEDTLLPFMIE